MCPGVDRSDDDHMNITSSPSARRRCLTGLMRAVTIAASLGVVGLLGSATPAAADEFTPAATLDVDTACVNGVFTIEITMGNVAGLDTAQFLGSTSTGNKGWAWDGMTNDVQAGDTLVESLTAPEGWAVTLHITSADATPAIDYSLAVTVDCIEDEMIPETTEVNSGGGGLPSTGSSSWLVAGLASLALLGGTALTRVTRRS